MGCRYVCICILGGGMWVLTAGRIPPLPLTSPPSLICSTIWKNVGNAEHIPPGRGKHKGHMQHVQSYSIYTRYSSIPRGRGVSMWCLWESTLKGTLLWGVFRLRITGWMISKDPQRFFFFKLWHYFRDIRPTEISVLKIKIPSQILGKDVAPPLLL